MTGVAVRCPAKVNLYLRVVAREDSGYHQIETVFQAIALYDRLEVDASGPGIRLSVDAGDRGTGDVPLEGVGPDDKNTVVSAARAFFEATGLEPAASIRLVKGIPAGTGLGGASSDAAGALLALNQLTGCPLGPAELTAIGGTIGADVPFFCAGAPAALGWGRGDRLLPLPAPPTGHVVVVVPTVRVGTADAYRALSSTLALPAPAAVAPRLQSGDWALLESLQHNDFESVILTRHPRLEELRTLLEGSGAFVARMTGSGSALFGIFEKAERAHSAAARLEGEADVARVAVVPTLTQSPTNPMEAVPASP